MLTKVSGGLNPGHLSVKYHTWFAKVSGMLENQVCSSQIVNECCAFSRQVAASCHWSLPSSGRQRNCGAAHAWESKCSDVSKKALTHFAHMSWVHEVPSALIELDWIHGDVNPWPKDESCLVLGVLQASCEPQRWKRPKGCSVTLFGMASGKDVLKAYNLSWVFF